MGEGVKRHTFGIEQLVAASEAARNFSALRKKAKLSPRLILENNKPDSVIISIEQYQQIQEVIRMLEDEIFELKAISRIQKAETEGVKTYKFDEFATEEDRTIVKSAKDWDISDEELFE
ncbi:type II toxin-antitoxin system Phd/YefM family antitoxin [Lysinibacillus sp. NPDC094403]|uniref:type II toxin-antitoxin system Phd/YefM family antitoxin n=1 Tax=Lysinibacillus sp. NPDC094403 TaxID=3390581 RepID=UPI003D07EEE1